MGLDDQAARIVDGLFQNPSFQSIPAIVLALLFSLAGMVGLAGMVQHLYEQTFAQPHRRSRGQLPRLLSLLRPARRHQADRPPAAQAPPDPVTVKIAAGSSPGKSRPISRTPAGRRRSMSSWP